MPYYGQDAVETVRDAVDIVDVISEFVPLKQKGKHYMALCPFHSEKTPSFSVNREKQIYYCFGCQAGGDVFSFLMEYQHLEFTQALERLAEQAGIELVPQKGDRRDRQGEQQLSDINLEAARYFYACFSQPAGKEAVAYLLGRDIQPETRKRFKLGYAPQRRGALRKHLNDKGFEDIDLARAGVLSSRESKGHAGAVEYYDRFRNRLMFPIENIRGQMIGFGGRVLGEGEPKYLNSPETPLFQKKKNLYAIGLALPEMKRTGQALLMEGYMDVIMSHQNGFINAVASLGTAFTDEQASLLSRYVEEVVLVYDSDPAGRKATRRAAEVFSPHAVTVRVAELGDAKDPDDFIKSHGRDAFESMIHRAKPFYEYILSRGIASSDLNDIEQKVHLTEALIPWLVRMKNNIKQSEYVKLTAERLQIDEESLRFEMDRYSSSRRLEEQKEARRIESKEKVKSEVRTPPNQWGRHGERQLLNLCLRDRTIYRALQDDLTQMDWSGSLTKVCFERLREQTGRNADDVHALLDSLEEQDRREVMACVMDEKNPADLETARAWLASLRKRNVLEDMGRLEKKMELLEKEGKGEELLEVKKRFLALQNELYRI